MKQFWRKLLAPFRITGIPFSHAWLIVVDEKNAQLDANVREIERYTSPYSIFQGPKFTKPHITKQCRTTPRLTMSNRIQLFKDPTGKDNRTLPRESPPHRTQAKGSWTDRRKQCATLPHLIQFFKGHT